MHGFKSAILQELKNCQNDTFESVHGMQKIFPAKKLILKHYKNHQKHILVSIALNKDTEAHDHVNN